METGGIAKKMTVAELQAHQKKRSRRSAQTSQADTGKMLARGTNGRIYAVDLPNDDAARIALAVLSKIKGKTVDRLTEPQYEQIQSERMTLKDGRTMNAPAWYMARYPQPYRNYLEKNVPKQFENLPKMKVHMGSVLGLTDGLPATDTERDIAQTPREQLPETVTYAHLDDIKPAWVREAEAKALAEYYARKEADTGGNSNSQC